MKVPVLFDPNVKPYLVGLQDKDGNAYRVNAYTTISEAVTCIIELEKQLSLLKPTDTTFGSTVGCWEIRQVATEEFAVSYKLMEKGASL